MEFGWKGKLFGKECLILFILPPDPICNQILAKNSNMIDCRLITVTMTLFKFLTGTCFNKPQLVTPETKTSTNLIEFVVSISGNPITFVLNLFAFVMSFDKPFSNLYGKVEACKHARRSEKHKRHMILQSR